MARTLSTAQWLKGKRVALAGRLASMSRAEAAQLIAAHGGVFVRSVTRAPTIVIVGRDGWPLAKDGRPTRRLRRALALARQGFDVRIVPEEELLERLHRSPERLRRHWTLRELPQMLGVSAERIEGWIRAGLIEPVATVDGIRYFDFCQVAGAKSLCDLVRSGITTSRLRQSLGRLRTWLGDIEHPLAQLTTLEHGRSLFVRLDSGQLAEPSGQLLFDFLPDAGDPFPASLPWVAEVRTVEEWCELARGADQSGDWAEAARAYRQALLAGGPRADICFELASVLYSMGHYGRSGERYRQVLELDPDFWEAWNNLGTVLTYQDQNEEAVAAYRQALRLHPHYADAHYNLADTLQDMGQFEAAREHWQAYLELEPQGGGAEFAREQLQRIGRR